MEVKLPPLASASCRGHCSGGGGLGNSCGLHWAYELQEHISSDRSHVVWRLMGPWGWQWCRSLGWLSCFGSIFIVGSTAHNTAVSLILNTTLCFSCSEASTSGVQSTKGCACRQGGHTLLPGAGGPSPATLQLVPQ